MLHLELETTQDKTGLEGWKLNTRLQQANSLMLQWLAFESLVMANRLG
jgi:hypothetical protein